MKTLPDDYRRELKKLGQRIKEIRLYRNLRLLDLEILSGINDSDLSRYERGMENIETIFKIAKALDVDVASLTDYEGKLPPDLNIKAKARAKKRS